MQFAIEKAVIVKVTRSKKEASTCFVSIQSLDTGTFDVMVTECDPAQFENARLVPVSISGVLIGSVYSGEGGSTQRLRANQFHIGKANGKG